MIGWRQVAADTLLRCASILAIKMAVKTIRLPMSARKWEEAVVEGPVKEQNIFRIYGCWITVLRFDDGGHFSRSIGIL
jgi:hypothetical protein